MTYPQLVRALQRGEQPPVEVVEATLQASGKTAADLVKSWLADPPPRAGDRCECCGDRYKVANTRASHGRRIQYLGCRSCGFRPPRNKITEMLPE